MSLFLRPLLGGLLALLIGLLGIDVGDNDLVYHLNSEEEPEVVLVYPTSLL